MIGFLEVVLIIAIIGFIVAIIGFIAWLINKSDE